MRLVLLPSPLCRWSMESWRERKWNCPGPHDEQSWEFWNSGLENFDAGRGTSPLLSMPSLDGEWSGICPLIHMTFWKRQTVKTEVRQWEEPLEEDQWLTYIGGQDELVQGSTTREIWGDRTSPYQQMMPFTHLYVFKKIVRLYTRRVKAIKFKFLNEI